MNEYDLCEYRFMWISNTRFLILNTWHQISKSILMIYVRVCQKPTLHLTYIATISTINSFEQNGYRFSDIIKCNLRKVNAVSNFVHSLSYFVHNRPIYKISALIQIMLLTAPSKYLYQCWTNVNLFIWHHMMAPGTMNSNTITVSSHERHNVSNHWQVDWLCNSLFKRATMANCGGSAGDRFISPTKGQLRKNRSMLWRHLP